MSSLYPGAKTLAFSAGISYIILGLILIFYNTKPFRGRLRILLAAILVLVIIIEAIEFPLNITGDHSAIEQLSIQVGNTVLGQPTTPISPVASILILSMAIALLLIIISSNESEHYSRLRNITEIVGLSVSLVSFTLIMSYVNNAPFLLETKYIPIAAPSLLSAFFLGLGFISAAGPSYIPLRYFTGPSVRARLLRTFLPLAIAIIFIHEILDNVFMAYGISPDALSLSVSIVIFAIITAWVVFSVSHWLGEALESEERRRKAAEEDLATLNEKLIANVDELVQREQELRTSEAKYRSLFENLLEGYAYCRMIYDDTGMPVDFIYLEVNHAFDEIIGSKNVTGRRFSEIFPGIRETYPELFAMYGRVAMNGRPETFDLDFQPAGKWLHISVYSPGKLHFVAIFEDISVRRKAEDALTLYKIFTENANDIILFIRKSDGRIIDANKVASLIYGYTREELLGMTIFELRDSDPREKVSDQMDQASREGLIFTTLHRKNDGTCLPVEVSSVAMIYDKEEVVVSIIRDISERMKAQEVESLLASIVTHSVEAIYAKTVSGIITSWNVGAERMYGYTPEEVIGKHVSVLAPPEYAGEIESVLAKIRAGIPVENFETIRVKKGGERFSVFLSLSPIKSANGELIGISTIAEDITRLKETEQALVIANKKISILNSITRHDINNQLTVIQGYLMLYHEGCQGDAKLQGYFDNLIKSVNLVQNKIEFTRAYEDIGVKEPVWQRIMDVVVKAKTAFDEIQFVVRTGDLEVHADILLETVFFNLFDNAHRHGGHVTEIQISAETRDGVCTIRVEDNGVGIPSEEKEHIFIQGVGKNTGLGLFLVREVLAITGIAIQENGEPEKGACFEIVVPKGAWRYG